MAKPTKKMVLGDNVDTETETEEVFRLGKYKGGAKPLKSFDHKWK